jgi:hypothetical protein
MINNSEKFDIDNIDTTYKKLLKIKKKRRKSSKRCEDEV